MPRPIVVFPFRYEFQMQYGSIGWSVGATLGYAQAAKDKRVIACIGDGSFQVRTIILLETRNFLKVYTHFYVNHNRINLSNHNWLS